MINSDSFRTWIACASYALLHALNNTDIDVVDLENSTGVPFGIASYSSQYYCTRMLTPFYTFWDGISTVQKVWGIRMEHMSALDASSMLSYLLSKNNKKLIIGPLNMSSLFYLPLCTQYKCVDHYIALHITDGRMYLIDSEGIPYLRIFPVDLKRVLNIHNILEARGRLNAAVVSMENDALDRTERLREIIRVAENNFLAAEESGQGGSAFLLCQQVMIELPSSRWASSLRYDLSYYMQRKYMMLMIDKQGICFRPEMKEHLTRQINISSKALRYLSSREYSEATALMTDLAREETMIPYKWKEWTKQV